MFSQAKLSNYWITLPAKTIEHGTTILTDTSHPSFEPIHVIQNTCEGCCYRLQLVSWLCNTNSRAVTQEGMFAMGDHFIIKLNKFDENVIENPVYASTINIM